MSQVQIQLLDHLGQLVHLSHPYDSIEAAKGELANTINEFQCTFHTIIDYVPTIAKDANEVTTLVDSTSSFIPQVKAVQPIVDEVNTEIQSIATALESNESGN